MFVLTLAVGLGPAAPSSASAVPPIEDPVKARLVAETRLDRARRDRVGRAASRDAGRAGMSIGAIPATPDCRPRSPGPCRQASPPARSTGRRPSALSSNGIGNYGYAGSVDLLVPITAIRKRPARRPAGPRRSAAQATWLACADICIPGGQSWRSPCLSPPRLPAPIRHTRRCSPLRAQRLPRPAGFATRLAVSGTDLTLRIPAAALAGIRQPDRLVLSERAQRDRRRRRAANAGRPPTGSTCC